LPNRIFHSGVAPRRWLAGFVVVTLGIGDLARADDGDEGERVTAPAQDLERAKAALEHGQKLYDTAKYDAALAAFEEAYRAYPVPDLHYNIGLCHERLGHPREAIAAFEAYLAGKPDAPDRPSVEHRIGELRADLEAPRPVEVVPPPPVVPAARIDASEQPENEAARTAIDQPPAKGRGRVVGGSIAFALGVGVGVGGGLGFGLPAQDRRTAIDRALADGAPDSDRMTEAQARETAREGDRFLALQIASVGVGAVLVGTGIGLMVVGKRQRRRTATASLAPTPRGIAVSGRF
jgi:tetratricopeptide (TPR) repeat protein